MSKRIIACGRSESGWRVSSWGFQIGVAKPLPPKNINCRDWAGRLKRTEKAASLIPIYNLNGL